MWVLIYWLVCEGCAGSPIATATANFYRLADCQAAADKIMQQAPVHYKIRGAGAFCTENTKLSEKP